jgi:hypothetical protein
MSARGMENGFPGDRRLTHSEPKLQWASNLLQVTEAIQKKLCVSNHLQSVPVRKGSEIRSKVSSGIPERYSFPTTGR